jgi:hypothetical protein
LYTLQNGCYVYHFALLIRPFSNKGQPLGVVEWNDPDLWKKSYTIDLSNDLFFAEDIFGMQFVIHEDSICTFDPETSQFEPMANSLAEWAEEVIRDTDFRTGYPLGVEWQQQNRPLQPGERLLPKVPFVLGGEFKASELYALNDVEGMRFRASIANQIRNLPDGAQVQIKIQ